MNQLETKQLIKKNWCSYKTPGCSNLHRRKQNAIFISSSNSLRHETAKLLISYMIHKYGDFKWNKYISESLKYLESSIERLMHGFEKDSTPFITESTPCAETNRRVDIVNLKTNDRVEIETDHSVKKDNCITVYI